MARREVGVVLPLVPPSPPPGIDPVAYARALLEDTVDAVGVLAGVTVALVVPPGADAALARAVAGKAYPVHEVADVTARAALSALDTELAAVLVADVPDIPGLVVAKLLGGLEDAPVAVCPAPGGGLAGLAARIPVPAWIGEVTLDDPGALEALHAAAPVKSVVVGPGWRRLREPADVASLDPGLDGWPNTRLLLGGSHRSR